MAVMDGDDRAHVMCRTLPIVFFGGDPLPEPQATVAEIDLCVAGGAMIGSLGVLKGL